MLGYSCQCCYRGGMHNQNAPGFLTISCISFSGLQRMLWCEQSSKVLPHGAHGKKFDTTKVWRIMWSSLRRTVDALSWHKYCTNIRESHLAPTGRRSEIRRPFGNPPTDNWNFPNEFARTGCGQKALQSSILWVYSVRIDLYSFSAFGWTLDLLCRPCSCSEE